jgi:hypothetical protein
LTDHNHIFRQLQRRVLLLPWMEREQLITTLTDARRRE